MSITIQHLPNVYHLAYLTAASDEPVAYEELDACPEYGMKRHEGLQPTRSVHQPPVAPTTPSYIPRIYPKTSFTFLEGFATRELNTPPLPPRHHGVDEWTR